MGFLEQRINDAVKQALEKLNGVWGKDIVEQYRHESVPTDLKAIDAALYHDTLDAYIKHLSSTGRKDKDGHLLMAIMGNGLGAPINAVVLAAEWARRVAVRRMLSAPIRRTMLRPNDSPRFL
ncbi:MAG: hypothetical protein ABFC88_05390 [Thermoguttaceae bacterium]